MKPIPKELLDEAEAKATPAVNKMGAFTADIFFAVADIKAAQRLGKDIAPAWTRLRTTLDDAVASGDPTAFKDLEKALKNVRVASTHCSIKSGNQQFEITSGRILNTPNSPVTVTLIKAIRNFQFDHHRAPNRQEILDEMNKLIEDGVDETEVSRQLTRLGWNDLI